MIVWQFAKSKYDPELPPEFYGFIYKITYDDGMVYYGKKALYMKKTRPPLKGYKRKRRSIVESNWRKYVGSSEEGKEKTVAKKEILEFANSKNHLSYLENKILYTENVLFDENCINRCISGKYYESVDKKVGEWLNADRFNKS